MIKWKQMVKFEGVEALEPEKHTDRYGKFCIRPLENGLGVTLGNALRRVLLSSIQGVAIVAVKIEGVMHEFSIIQGCVEDVSEILLNIKKIDLKAESFSKELQPEIRLSLSASGKCFIKAGDIVCPPGISVINTEQHIAELSLDGKIDIEFLVDVNRGYIPANEYALLSHIPKRFMVIDCDFSPIKRVGFETSNYRINNKTDYDKLEIEIETNKSITPRKALSFAAVILRDHFNSIIDRVAGEQIYEEATEDKRDLHKEHLQDLLRKSITELELTVRPVNCLQAAHITTLGDLVRRTEAEMLKYRNFGRKSLEELKKVLAEYDLKLGMNLDGIDIEFGIAPEEMRISYEAPTEE
jgi:DNA-directed RNA polymerase subunit alpha